MRFVLQELVFKILWYDTDLAVSVKGQITNLQLMSTPKKKDWQGPQAPPANRSFGMTTKKIFNNTFLWHSTHMTSSQLWIVLSSHELVEYRQFISKFHRAQDHQILKRILLRGVQKKFK